MRSAQAFADANTIVWMFLTVILGAVLILTGMLPLQILGTALIAIGMATPIALAGTSRKTVQRPVDVAKRDSRPPTQEHANTTRP
jgi:hypothetical protein